MKKTLTSTILFIFISLNSFIFSTTYYVSPTGLSTNSGSILSPLNFSSAIGKYLVVGDSLIFRGGTYSFSTTQSFSKSGAAGNLIHYVAYQSEIPIFDFRTQVYNSNSRGLNLSGNYMHIKGITVQGAGDNGFYVEGNYCLIEQCTARWNSDSGFQFKVGSNNYILNCDSYENFDYESGGLSSPDYGGNADGFADKQYTNTGTNKYKGCRSWRNGDDGWDSYQKVGNTVYDSCWCLSMSPATFDMSQHIRFKTDSASWFVNFKSTNYIMRNYGNGNGFKLGGDYTKNNATLNNCISVNNPVKGFDQNNNDGIMTVSNCTAYNNGSNYGFSNSSYGTLIIKNCVSLSSKGSNSFNSKSVTQAYNTWNAGFSCSSSDFVSLDYSQMLNARQPDGSLPEITLLHLVPTSALIDKGTNLGYPFVGSAPDLGAFEYSTITGNSDISTSKTSIYYSRLENGIIVNGSVSNIEIFGLTGKKLVSQQIKTNHMKISTSDWATGIYLVHLNTENNQSVTQKIIVN